MAAFNDFLEKQKGIEPGQPLDTGAGTQPRTTFKEFLAQQSDQPTVEPETIKAVTKEQPSQKPTVSDIDTPKPTDRFLQGAGAGGQLETPDRALSETPEELSAGLETSISNFARDEGLPTVIGTAAAATAGTLMLGATAPVSVPLMLLGTALGGAVGGFAGEVVEQELKMADVIGKPASEADIQTQGDILKQAGWRGLEEGVFSLVPDVLYHGTKVAAQGIFKFGAQSENILKVSLENTIRKEAAKRGDAPIRTLTDVTDVAAFEMMDALASNSLMKSRLVHQKAAQTEQVLGAAERFIGEQKIEAAEFGLGALDKDIRSYVGAAYENMNAHGVAAITRKALTDAQEVQKSLARAKYSELGDVMEPQIANAPASLVDTGKLDPRGKPIYSIKQPHINPSFPVDLKGPRAVAEKQMDLAMGLVEEDAQGKAFGMLTPEMKELLSFKDVTDFKSASAKLAMMKGESRSLVGVENAANRKRLLDDAITALDDSLNTSLKAADEAGVRGADGMLPSQMKAEGDAIWKEQSEDFGNRFIKEILTQTDRVNGAPEELAKLFLKDDTHALKIIKALDQGGDLESMDAARSAIKGSVADGIFAPFNPSRGKFSAPAHADLEGRESALKMLFSGQEYDDMVDIANSLSRVHGEDRANILSFAQQARESGAALQLMQDMTTLKDPITNFQKFYSTMLTAFGAGRILTTPGLIKTFKNASDTTLPPYLQRQYMTRFTHTYMNFLMSQEASMSPEQREQWQQRKDDNDAVSQARQQQ